MNADNHNVNPDLETKKHHDCEDKSLMRIDQEECPTRANLPPPEDPFIESVEILNEPTSAILEGQLGNDIGDEGQNQSPIPKITDTTQDEECPGPAQKKKCYQASSDVTPINKKLLTTNDNTAGAEATVNQDILIHVRGDIPCHTYMYIVYVFEIHIM